MSRFIACALTMVAASIFMFACGANSHPNEDIQVLLNMQTETDVRAAASHSDAEVTVSIHRNGLRGSEFNRDPEIDSPYDTDIIVRNRRGFPFLMSGNLGIPLDPDTGLSPELPDVIFDNAEQIADLNLLIESVNRLSGEESLGTSYRWELRTLFHMAKNALTDAESPPNGSVADDEHSQQKGEIGVGTFAYTAPYTHTVAIRRAVCCNNFGDHSAVRLSVKDSLNVLVGVISTRNHGREADDPSMSNASGCPKSFSGRTNAMPPLQPFVATDTDPLGNNDAGGCSTAYVPLPGIVGHVCNDDSWAEYTNVKNNSAGYGYSVCADTFLNALSPTCY